MHINYELLTNELTKRNQVYTDSDKKSNIYLLENKNISV